MRARTTQIDSQVGKHALQLVAVVAVALSTMVALSAPAFAAKKHKAPADPYLAADLKAPGATLTGAGSTFDQPFFTKAFYIYNQKNSSVTVNYASIGAVAGSRSSRRHGQLRCLRRPDGPADIASRHRRAGAPGAGGARW